LSRLVNQATQAVKNMGYILKAARSERPKQDIFANGTDIKVDSAMIADIEESLQFILEDSRKIMQMLDSVKQRSLDDFRST
jgi:hypothetical protein